MTPLLVCLSGILLYLDYRQQFNEEYLVRKKKLIDSVQVNNYQVLRIIMIRLFMQ